MGQIYAFSAWGATVVAWTEEPGVGAADPPGPGGPPPGRRPRQPRPATPRWRLRRLRAGIRRR